MPPEEKNSSVLVVIKVSVEDTFLTVVTSISHINHNVAKKMCPLQSPLLLLILCSSSFSLKQQMSVQVEIITGGPA